MSLFEPPPLPGDQVDSYKLLETLGIGGNATVYKATCPKHGFVAIKILHPGKTTKEDVKRMEKIISDKRKWVISIRSGTNILLGENYIYAFPEVLLNKKIVRKGDVISRKEFPESELEPKILDREIKFLLTSTLAKVKRKGSLVSEITIDTESVNKLRKESKSLKRRPLFLEIISLRDSETADPISVKLNLK